MADEETPPEGETPPEEPPPEGEEEPKVYDEAYVARLRDEAAAARVKARQNDGAMERLRAAVTETATRGVLVDPTDLPWDEAFSDEDGFPDQEKIREAAEDLIETKPHLGRARGNVGQGEHSEDEGRAVSLTELLREGA